jgi:hypothetical protein
MKEFQLHFEQLLMLYDEGNLTKEDFFKWMCDQVIKYGGKLPPIEPVDDINSEA